MAVLDKLAGLVGKTIARYGQSVTYRTVTPGAYSPATGASSDTETDSTVSALVEDYPNLLAQSADSDAGGIRRGDKKLTVAASALATPPTPKDRVQVGGVWYNVVSIDAQYGSADALYYVIQARR